MDDDEPWDPEDRLAKVARTFDAALDEIRARLAAIEEGAAETARKEALVRASEGAWAVVLQARGVLVLRNAVGATAELPVQLASLIARRQPLDVEVVWGDDDSSEIVFKGPDDEELARLPRALWVGLDRALASWTPRAARAAGLGLAAATPRDGGTPSPASRNATASATVSSPLNDSPVPAAESQAVPTRARPRLRAGRARRETAQ